MFPAKHPLNQAFDWQPIRGPFRRLSQDQAEHYNQHGFCIVENAIEPQVLERVIAEIDPLDAQTEAFLATRDEGRLFISRAGELTFSAHLVTRSAYLKEFVASRVFCDIAADVIGPDVRLYWDQAVYKKPGTAVSFPWHQDNGYTFIEPQQYLTCWIALTDVDQENGCPEVAPGLHRQGTLEHELTEHGYRCLPDDVAGIPAPAPAGSIVVFSSLTPHRTGPNTSDDVRKAYIVQFAPDGVQLVAADGSGGTTRTPANDPERQFPILVGARPQRA